MRHFHSRNLLLAILVCLVLAGVFYGFFLTKWLFTNNTYYSEGFSLARFGELELGSSKEVVLESIGRPIEITTFSSKNSGRHERNIDKLSDENLITITEKRVDWRYSNSKILGELNFWNIFVSFDDEGRLFKKHKAFIRD